jgi:hypothetical protein
MSVLEATKLSSWIAGPTLFLVVELLPPAVLLILFSGEVDEVSVLRAMKQQRKGRSALEAPMGKKTKEASAPLLQVTGKN